MPNFGGITLKMSETLQTIANFVVLVGGVAGAILTILHLLDIPIGKARQHRQQHEAELSTQIGDTVSQKLKEDLKGDFDAIKAQNTLQSENINVLAEAMQNSVGAEIANFYEIRKDDGVISLDELASLKDLYRAYKSVNGNHYGDAIWTKITAWTVLDDKGREVQDPHRWEWKDPDVPLKKIKR